MQIHNLKRKNMKTETTQSPSTKSHLSVAFIPLHEIEITI